MPTKSRTSRRALLHAARREPKSMFGHAELEALAGRVL